MCKNSLSTLKVKLVNKYICKWGYSEQWKRPSKPAMKINKADLLSALRADFKASEAMQKTGLVNVVSGLMRHMVTRMEMKQRVDQRL